MYQSRLMLVLLVVKQQEQSIQKGTEMHAIWHCERSQSKPKTERGGLILWCFPLVAVAPCEGLWACTGLSGGRSGISTSRSCRGILSMGTREPSSPPLAGSRAASIRAASTEALPPPASTWPPPTSATSFVGAFAGGALGREAFEDGLCSCEAAAVFEDALGSGAASRSSLGRRATPGD